MRLYFGKKCQRAGFPLIPATWAQSRKEAAGTAEPPDSRRPSGPQAPAGLARTHTASAGRPRRASSSPPPAPRWRWPSSPPGSPEGYARGFQDRIKLKEAAAMTDQELVKKAFEMHQFSYVPYSHFPVGAALLSRTRRRQRPPGQTGTGPRCPSSGRR